MPLFGFKKQFVPYVENGTKRQTIRAFRKYPVLPGSKAHLYYALRTKQARKLVSIPPTIKKVQIIAVLEDGSVGIYDHQVIPEDHKYTITGRIKQKDYFLLKPGINNEPITMIDGIWLDEKQKNDLAWCDGFREPGHVSYFDQMLNFFKKSHSLPFIGNIIYW